MDPTIPNYFKLSRTYTNYTIRLKLPKLHHLRALLCKNQTKWEMKNFEPPTQIYMEVGPREGCSKMSIIEVITQLLPW